MTSPHRRSAYGVATDCLLSLNIAGVRIRPGHVRKVPVTWVVVVVFASYTGVPTASRFIRDMAENVTKNRNS